MGNPPPERWAFHARRKTLLLTIKQTARRLQVGSDCAYSLTKAERDPLPTATIGRSIRVPVSALERWLEARTRG